MKHYNNEPYKLIYNCNENQTQDAYARYKMQNGNIIVNA